jgi:protein-disulfide isomerase
MDREPDPPFERPSPFLIPFSIIISGLLIGAGIYFSSTNPPKPLTQNSGISGISDSKMKPVTSEDHILGNPNAEVFVVEYSDTECPFCKSFHKTMHRIMESYGKDGNVAWVYRQFPIDQLHARARKEAEATECVAELGGNDKFWEYLDAIFEKTNSNDSLDPAELPLLAVSVGVDLDDFTECFESGRHANKVLESIQDAIRAGSKGTPSSIIVTRSGEQVTLEGDQPFDTLKSIIDAALAN